MESGTSLWVFEISRLHRRGSTDCVFHHYNTKAPRSARSAQEQNWYTQRRKLFFTVRGRTLRALSSYQGPFILFVSLFCDNARKVKKARAILSTYSSNFIGIKLAPGCLLVYSLLGDASPALFPSNYFLLCWMGKWDMRNPTGPSVCPQSFFSQYFFWGRLFG